MVVCCLVRSVLCCVVCFSWWWCWYRVCSGVGEVVGLWWIYLVVVGVGL